MQKLIVANLKMNILTLAERERYFESFKNEMKKRKIEKARVVVCPPAVHVETFVKKINSDNFSIGAQDVFWEERGAYTGEISAPMLKSLGAEYVILGHSERRKYFSETNAIVNAKVKAALKSGLTPILCIGETKKEREKGEVEKIIIEQTVQCLDGIPVSKISSIVAVYEPVWSVGSNIVPTSNEILEAKILIKKILTDNYGSSVVEKIPILYGGSVKTANVQMVCIETGLDGALVGGESLIPSEFAKIVEIIDRN